MKSSDKYTNHKCKITIDADGNELKTPIIQEYGYMSSELDLMAFMEGRFIGKGECISVVEYNSGRVFPISGEGYFYKSFTKEKCNTSPF